MINLLKTMIEASKAAVLPLNMTEWHCGTACCLCGDAADYLGSGDDLHLEADCFSDKLDKQCFELFGSEYLASSVYSSHSENRIWYAEESNVFTDKELEHPHLTSDHGDRAIAIDYIEMVIRKCEGAGSD